MTFLSRIDKRFIIPLTALGIFSLFAGGILGLCLMTFVGLYVFSGEPKKLRGRPLFQKYVLKVIFDVVVLSIAGLLFVKNIYFLASYIAVLVPILYALGVYKEAVTSFNYLTVLDIFVSIIIIFVFFFSYELLTDGISSIYSLFTNERSRDLVNFCFSALVLIPMRAFIAFSFDSISENRTDIGKVILFPGLGNEGDLVTYIRMLHAMDFDVTHVISESTENRNRSVEGVDTIEFGMLRQKSVSTDSLVVLVADESESDDLARRRGLVEKAGFSVRIIQNIAQNYVDNVLEKKFMERNLERIIRGEGTKSEIDNIPIAAVDLDSICLVTGGAGSIGAELINQLIILDVEEVIVFDQSEYQLFELENRLAEVHPSARTRISFVIGNINDEESLESLFKNYRPNVVFHAAALKHVPLVEKNPKIGFRTNVEGTNKVLEQVRSNEVEHFCLVSTDKAVKPASVMGLTKRLAEILVDKHARENHDCSYSIVRFGNVIGSSGSILPRFTEQIRSSSPVTVTDPYMTRYFMTIPEAAQLVIMASLTVEARYGFSSCYVLDMGKPVRIMEIVEELVSFAGKKLVANPTKAREVSIDFIGKREGEKLEEQLTDREDLVDTVVPKIKVLVHSSDRNHLDEFSAAMSSVQTSDAGTREYYGKRYQKLIGK